MEEASTSNAASLNWNDFLKKKEEFANLPVPQDWKGWFAYKFIEWSLFAVEDPWGFTSTILILVTPLFFLSAVCSYKLAKILEKEEEDKKRKARKRINFGR
ncbi:Small integral membrane protein 15 [Taenia crassiceps]|uniref:Small integral membrane protein 15 n=1 Tax=Taenia crassiceps TaxID=6207 RepID=A0ABR4QIB4_9CEST